MRKINFVQPVIFGYQSKEEGRNFNEEFQLLYPAIAESIKNLIAGLTGTEVKNNYKSLVDFQTSNMFKQDFKVSLNIVEETFTSVVYTVTIHDIANKPWSMFSETKAAKVTGPSIGLPYFTAQEETPFTEKPKAEQNNVPQKAGLRKPSLLKSPSSESELTLSELQLLTKVSNSLLTCDNFPKEPSEVSGVPVMYLYYFRNKKLCSRITKDRNLFFLKKIEEAIDQGKIKQPSNSSAENHQDFYDKLSYLKGQGIDVANLLGYGLIFLSTIGTQECVFTPEECRMLNNKLDVLFDDYKSGKLRVVKTTAVELKTTKPTQEPVEVVPEVEKSPEQPQKEILKEIFKKTPEQRWVTTFVEGGKYEPGSLSKTVAKMTKFNKSYLAKAKEEIKSNKYTRNGVVIKSKISKMCFLENRRRLFLISHSMQKVSSLLDIPFSILKKVTNFANPPSNEEQLALHLYLNDNKEVIQELEKFGE